MERILIQSAFLNKQLPRNNLQTKFDTFPWINNKTELKKWQLGQTGYPIIDAGMRELWQTGYMHNRVRMIVGSFLVKNLNDSLEIWASMVLGYAYGCRYC